MTNAQYNRLRTHLNHGFFLALLLWPGPHLRPWALLLMAAGTMLRTWAAGLLCKNRVLTTAGPYRFTRNPLYVGSLLSGLGAALFAGNDWLLLAVLLFVPLYHGMIKREEADLGRFHGEAYQGYLAQVPRYLGLRVGPPQAGGFSWRMAVTNREYEAWLALSAFVGLLALRMWLWP